MSEPEPPPKLKALFRLLSATPVAERPKLAILTDSEFLFSYQDRLTHSEFVPGHGPISGLRPERGDIMDMFVQLELITNQILVAHLIRGHEAAEKLEALLDRVDVFSKIQLLESWEVISKRTKQQLHALRAVRNGFAHVWDVRSIQYRGQPLVQQFEQFKADAAEAFDALLRLYNGGDIDVDGLIARLSPR